MKRRLAVRLMIVLSVLLSCQSQDDAISLSIIPKPQSVSSNNTWSSIDSLRFKFKESDDIAQFYPWIETWMPSSLIVDGQIEGNVSIKKIDALKTGAYTIEIKDGQIIIGYSEPDGLKNAFSSLQQLYVLNRQKLPELKIEDSGKFGYRGMHLDVSRHLFSVGDIKKYIDYLAFYKYNVFHWHLTDDQGWRIEIKKFPRLQEISAYRKETLIGHYNDLPQKFDGKTYGGYYKQEEIREIVEYAHQRGIQIIPEIDLPGHSSALLAAYPQLACVDKKYETATKWGVFFDVLCPKEETFEFLYQIFDEVIDLFPSEYIHIGGDECPKDAWRKSSYCQSLIIKEGLKDEYALQSYFIGKLEKYLEGKGKKIIGWDEILEGGIAANATVMSWRGIEGGIEAANMGHDVVMTPTSHCYFDYYQSENPDEPLAIGGYLPLHKVYGYNPIPENLPEDKHHHILGAQGNVWTEYLSNFQDVEYMALARSATLSEVLWGKNHDSIDGFYPFLYNHIRYWQGKDVNFANHLLELDISLFSDSTKIIKANIKAPITRSEIYLRRPSDKEFVMLSGEECVLNEKGEYQFYAHLDGLDGTVKEVSFNPHKGNKAKIHIVNKPAEKYSGKGSYSLINGVLGSDEKYGGNEWLGFNGDDFEAEIRWDSIIDIRSIQLRFFKGEGQWIYLPGKIEMYGLEDNGNFRLLSTFENIDSDSKIAKLKIELKSLSTNRIKIIAVNHGIIPEGRQGAGHMPWLFVDEIIIE